MAASDNKTPPAPSYMPPSGGIIRKMRPMPNAPASGVSVTDLLKQLITAVMSISPRTVRGVTSPVAVTVDAQKIVVADPNRRFIFIQNNHSTATVTIAFGVAPTSLFGIKLGAGGGAILLDNNAPTCDVYALGSVALNSSVIVVTA